VIQFTPLASSSAGCAYLLTAEHHKPLLIECGLSYAILQKRLWEQGVDVTDLAGCLISHSHGDHAKATAKIMAAGVDCYASRECWQTLGLAGHRAKDVGNTLYRGIEGWMLYPFRVVHDEPGTLGFMVVDNHGFKSEGDHLLYLTDSAYCPYRFEGLTHVCVEANYDSEILKGNVMAGRLEPSVGARTIGSHASIGTVVDMLKANDLSKVREIHLLHLSDANSDAAAFKQAVQEACGVPCYVAGKNGGTDAKAAVEEALKEGGIG
jgi:phosphoribosyl 1,2-cyclic phosphodiesterase